MTYERVLNSVGESSAADVQPLREQLEKSGDASERMVEENSLDASVMAHSSQHASPSETNEETSCHELAPVFTNSGDGFAATAPRGNLGILGTSARSETEKVRAQISASPTHDMKVVDICRLLNSTSLGQVIDERQLYRHRLRAGVGIQNGRKVNLLKYIGWLVEVRHFELDIQNDPIPRPGSVSAAKILKLLELQKYRCALTGRKLVPTNAALDHVLPISRNGTNTIENAQVLDTDVNRAKGALTNEEFIKLCREVTAWANRSLPVSFSSLQQQK